MTDSTPTWFGQMWIAAVVLAAISIPGSARGATISLHQTEAPKAALVVIEGNFEAGDEKLFESTVAGLSGAIVSFNSDGGNLIAALKNCKDHSPTAPGYRRD